MDLGWVGMTQVWSVEVRTWRLGLQGGLQGGHQVGLHGGHQEVLQGV